MTRTSDAAYFFKMKNIICRLEIRSLFGVLPALIAGLLVTSCVTKPKPEPEEKVAATPDKPKPLYEWNGKGRTATHVKVNIDEQKAHVFSGKDEIGWATVATGISKYPTPVGDFKVIEKVADKKSNLFGKAYNKDGKLVNSDAKMGRDSIPEGGRFEGATMPYYLRLTGDGVGMHAGPIPRPGHRASHGCIRMPRSFAPLIFASISVGTPVTISGEGPPYSAYIKRQEASASKIASSKAQKKADGGDATTKAASTAPAATSSSAAATTPPTASTTPEPKPAATTPPAMKEPAVEIKPAVVPGQ